MATPTSASQDPWQLAKSRFLEDLDPHEKDLFNHATLENIYYSTSNTNRDDAENSKTCGVVRRLGPLVSAIESYGGAFDTFAQISPQYLLPIWGSIRVVLVVAGSYTKFYDKIVDTLGRIGDILPRFRDYERIYNGQKHQRLYRALSNAYLDIITLCTEFRKSIREQKTSKVRRILKPLSFDKQFDEAIERFRRHRQNVVNEAETSHMIEAAEQRDAQLVLFAEERRRKLLARLSQVDSTHRHRRLKESRHDGTGTWLTACSEYEQWKGASQSSVLCCYGIPGCGKSVLASSIIDSFDARGALVFYYCDYSDKRTLEPSNVFATLARQALEQVEILPETLASEIEQVEHDGEKLGNPAKALIILQKSLELVRGPIFLVLDGLDEATEPSQVLICNNLKQLIEKSGLSIKLFITGRDELGSLLMLDESIPFSRVPISSAAISLDIENYVRASTRRRISDGLLVINDPDLEQVIVDELVKGAKGMFLWVEFQLHDLCEPESDHGIRLVLENLPRSLGETYERLLNKIDGTERRDMIQRMFKWIVCAREPIHLDEMREAVAFTLDDMSYDPRKLPTDLNRLVRACGNLVVVDEETQVVQLAHHTVQQYLLQEHGSPFQFTVTDANVMAGEFCVAYLSFSNLESQVTRYSENKNTEMLALAKLASRGRILASDHPAQKVAHALNSFRPSRSKVLDIDMTRHVPPQRKLWQPTNFGFLSYVVAHWLWHTKFFDANYDAKSGEKDRRSRLFKNLVLRKQLLFDFRPWGDFDNLLTYKINSIALLGWALMANHSYLIHVTFSDISWHLTRDAWFATKSKYSWTWEGWDERSPSEVDFLRARISNKPHLNHLDLDYDLSSYTSDSPDLFWLFSRLLLACQKGHIDAIKAVNSDYHSQMIPYLSVAAAAKGQLDVVRYLLQLQPPSGKPFLVVSNQSKGHALSAIVHAAISGHSQVVRYLANHGAPSLIQYEGDSPSYFFQTIFGEAIIHNNHPVIESLLTLFAVRRNIEVQTMDFCHFEAPVHGFEDCLSDTLVTAAIRGSIEIVRTLLKNGVDPNRPNAAGHTPLVEAIRHSRDSVVSILLEHQCSLEITARGMPLTIAASLGNIGIVRELLLHGADVFGGESIRLENMTFFSYAGESVVASEDMRHQPIRIDTTPLYMACYYGYLNIVELLLSYGAATNLPSPTSIIWMEQNRTATATVECSFVPLPKYTHCSRELYDLLSGDFIKWWPFGEGSWELPITAAINRGHATIVDTLILSGALWPEEFNCLYGSYFGLLDVEFEDLASHVFTSLMAGPVSYVEIGDLPLMFRLRWKRQRFSRTFMTKMALPEVTAGRIYSSTELHLLNSVGTASQLRSFESEKQQIDQRIEDLKNDMLSDTPNCRDPLQACLIKLARNWHFNDGRDAQIRALIDTGASLVTSCDGVVIPNLHLVEAARCGNSTLRQALLDIIVAATFSPLDTNERSIDQEKLARMIQQIVTPRNTVSRRKIAARPTNIAYHIGEIIEAATENIDEKLVRRLYEILVFAFRNSDLCSPSAALFAAVDHENPEVVELLCKYGANLGIDVNMRDYHGKTPLLYAIEQYASVSIIATLLSHGADPRLADYHGETLLYKAAASHNSKILHSLMIAKQRGQHYLDNLDLQLALELCIARDKLELWYNLAGAVGARELAPLEKRNTTELTAVAIIDGHQDKPIPWLSDRHVDKPDITSYEKARGQHLLRIPCRHVEGLFELSAVQYEIETPQSPVQVISADEPQRITKLSEAAISLLQRYPDVDLLVDLEEIEDVMLFDGVPAGP